MTRALAALAAMPLLVLGSTGAPPAPAHAAVAQEPGLAAGIRQVEEGDFEGAVATLGPVADRLSAAGGHDAAQACLYLGIAQLALDQGDAARARFREALGHEPSLRLSPDRFSPKVLSAFEEARREREAAAHAAAPAAGARAEPKKSHAGRTLLLAGAGVAAGVGVALAAGGSGSTSADGELRLTGARFAAQAIECPDGSVDQPIGVGIDVDAVNGGRTPAAITSVSSVLIIVSSALAGEIGFASAAATTASPTTVPSGMATLHVQTTLRCSNGVGDPPRFNEWSGRVTLATAAGVVTVETADRLRVNIP
jgi:hypothetical protein